MRINHQKNHESGSNESELRIIHVASDQQARTHDSITASSSVLDPADPRWLFATRVQMNLGNLTKLSSIDQYERLVRAASSYRLSNLQARAIIGIVEHAQERGGLDRCAAQEIGHICCSDKLRVDEHSQRMSVMTFAVLFSWALIIALLMQLV